MSSVSKNSAAVEATSKLYLNEEFSDVCFAFSVDREIVAKVPANKAILAVLSPVFKAMFFGELREKGDVPIVDADADGFKEFLQFFYLDEVTLTMENIETVVRLADKYDISNIVNDCAVKLKSRLTMENMCLGFQLGLNLKNKELIHFCGGKIARSPKAVFASDDFKRCDKVTLEQILGLSLLCNEVDIFDACLTWAKRACEQNDLDGTQDVNLRDQLGNCWKLIQFCSMTKGEFCKCYVSHKGLFTSEEFEDIMLSLSMSGYQPKIFNQIPRRNLFIWDENNVLFCNRRHGYIMLKTNEMQTEEVASFSANTHLFLGKFQTSYACKGSSTIFGTDVTVTITEREELTFQSAASPKILYEATSNTWRNGEFVVILPQPILIEPQRLYELRLKLQSTNGCTYYSGYEPMLKMKDGTEIQFHRNPTLDYDNSTNGWITYMSFNKA